MPLRDELTDHLRAAIRAGIISSAQADSLAGFITARMGEPGPAADAMPSAAMLEEDPEAPRFVRGFHDILITIGVVLGLSGLLAMVITTVGNWFVASLVTAGAAWLLSEQLVRRMRLALPAIALAIAVVLTIGISVSAVLSGTMDTLNIEAGGVQAFLASGLAAALFFWRFRVPFSLALLFGSAGGAIIAGYVEITGHALVGRSGELILLALALAIFVVALAFDFSDPARRTRRSDYAFWLHLMAAPALIGSVMSLLVGIGSIFSLGRSLSLVDAVVIIVTMAAMSVVAILIDRRAFLVAGLGYLGAAISSIATTTSLSDGLTAAITVMAVGVTVLGLALAWQSVRAGLLAVVPAGLRAKLPPLHRAPVVARLTE